MTEAFEKRQGGTMTEINFRDTYCRWRVGPLVGGVRQPDELHVGPKTNSVRKQLEEAMGQIVGDVANYSPTRYRVEREVDGVFVLTNAKEAREGNED